MKRITWIVLVLLGVLCAGCRVQVSVDRSASSAGTPIPSNATLPPPTSAVTAAKATPPAVATMAPSPQPGGTSVASGGGVPGPIGPIGPIGPARVDVLVPRTAVPTPTPELAIPVETSFPVPSESAIGIAYDGKHLWMTGGWAALELAEDGNVIHQYKIVAGNSADSLVWRGQQLWSAGFIRLYQLQVQAQELRAEQTIDLPESLIRTSGLRLLWNGQAFVVSAGARVYQLDPSAGKVLDTFVAPAEVKGLAWDGTYLWIATGSFEGDGRLWAVDGRGRFLASFPLPILTRSLVWNKDWLWVLGSKKFGGNLEVYKLNVSGAKQSIAKGLEKQAQTSFWETLQVADKARSSYSVAPVVEFANETAEKLTLNVKGFGELTVGPNEKLSRALGQKGYEYEARIGDSAPLSGRYTLENGFQYVWTFRPFK